MKLSQLLLLNQRFRRGLLGQKVKNQIKGPTK